VELAGGVFRRLCNGGWFQNEEMRLENWIGHELKFNEWRERTIQSARNLGILLCFAQGMETVFRQTIFQECYSQKLSWDASIVTGMCEMLLEIVKLTVNASLRALAEGGPCEYDAVTPYHPTSEKSRSGEQTIVLHKNKCPTFNQQA
jgi:hypothetical protein